MVFKSLLLAFFLTLIPLFADASLIDAEFRGEAKAKISFLEKQNTELKTKLDSLEEKQKSVEEYRDIIDRQDLQIVSLKDTLTNILALFAFFASISGYLIYSKAQLNAKAEAQKWLAENSKYLQEKIEDLEKNIEKNKKHVEARTKEYNQMIGNALKSVPDIQKDMEKLSNKNDSKQEQKEEQERTFDFAATLIKQNPESEYTFNEWNILAFDAIHKNRKEDAVFYWTKAFENGHSSEIALSQVLFNKGFTLGELNDNNKAIEVYEELDRRFKDNKNEQVQEQVVKALLHKGLIISKNNMEQAIEVYEELDRRFKDNKNGKVQEEVAKAIANIGFNLGRMNKNTEALKAYKEVIQRFHGNKNKKIEQIVLDTLINLFECELIENQQFDTKILQQCLEYINNNKQVRLQFKMLETIKDSLDTDPTLILKQLKIEFQDTNFGNWSWKELDAWALTLEGKQKERVLKTINFFQNWDLSEESLVL